MPSFLTCNNMHLPEIIQEEATQMTWGGILEPGCLSARNAPGDPLAAPNSWLA